MIGHERGLPVLTVMIERAEIELGITQMTGGIDVEIVTVMTMTGGDLRISMTGEISVETDLESRENSSELILLQQNLTPICSAA